MIVSLNLLTSKLSIADPIDDIIERELLLAYASQVESQGYAKPEKYEIKIARLHRRDAKTERRENGILTTIDSRILDEALPAYVHHEYAHACQIMWGGPSKSVFADEASATFQEMRAFGGNGTWKKAVAEFQEHPEIPPFVDVGELEGRLKATSKFEYGGALFLRFLDLSFGKSDGTWLRGLWQSAQAQLPSTDNAKWASLIEECTERTFDELVLEFANYRQRDSQVQMKSISVDFDHDVFVSPFEWPLPLGCIVLRVPSSSFESQFAMRSRFERSLGIAWRKVFDATGLEESGIFRIGSLESETSWKLKSGQSLMLSLCNLDKDAFLRRDWNVYALKLAVKVK